MTTVVNIKTREPFDIYIGRACPRARDPRCHVASTWANWHRGGGSAEERVWRYEMGLRVRLTVRPGLRAGLLALEGKRLGCWCKPNPCHGDEIVRVLGDLLDGLEPINSRMPLEDFDLCVRRAELHLGVEDARRTW